MAESAAAPSTRPTTAPSIALGPGPVRTWLRQLIEPTGCTVAEDPATADALVWVDPRDADGLRAALAANPGIRWVQLPMAGVEKMAAAGLFDGAETDGRTFTAAKGIYGEPVAEHALALLLAGLRDLDQRAGATTWGPPSGRSLFGAKVTVVGAGGIAEALLRLLEPFRVEATLVRRQAEPGAGGAGLAAGPGVARVLPRDRLHDGLADADAVVLALALTPETVGIVAAPELDAMQDHAWLVNVARGRHVVTADLVDALNRGAIGGAALDVTDPEPLPDDHDLWGAPRCIITPHVANTEAMARPHLFARIQENARRFAQGEPLLGQVDPAAGY